MTPVLGGRGRRAFLGTAMALCSGAFVVSACGDSDSIATLRCGPSIGPSTITGNINVTYSASLEGTGLVNSITYVTDAGPVVVNNPPLLWELTVLLVTSPAAIRAAGSVTTGTITVGYSAVGAPDRAEQDSATCSQTLE